jgi:hypothetical protein
LIRWVALGALLLGAVALRAEQPAVLAQASSPSASASETASAAVAVPAAPWPESGFEYGFGATALTVFNASPLALTPFELGWRFASGLHVREAVDVFYYDGLDSNAKDPDSGILTYSYEMRDLRTSLLYTVPLPGHLRPNAGLTFEMISGTRKLAGTGLLNPPTMDAWGTLGMGAVLGGEYRYAEHWSLEVQGRYTFSFGSSGPVTALGLGLVYLL